MNFAGVIIGESLTDKSILNFSGTEEILFGGKVVYRCLIHGGFIK